jgi:hypothetical protein
MNDVVLTRLIRALDTAVEASAPSIAPLQPADVDQAALRLRVLTGRLGAVAGEGPYLSFLRRVLATPARSAPSIAASA